MPSSHTLTHKIIKGSTIVLFFSILASPLGYLTRLLYSRTLSVEDYGLFYAVLALLMMIETYNDLGFGFSVAYFVPKFLKRQDLQSVWNVFKYDQLIEVCTAMLISLVLVALAPWLSRVYFKEPQAANLIYVLSVYLVSHSYLSSVNRLFNGLQQEVMYASIQLIKPLFTLGFSLILWWSRLSTVLWAGVAWSVSFSLAALLYGILLKRTNATLVRHVTWDKPLFQKMLTYAIPTLISTSIATFITSTDTLFLTWLRSVREVGIYSVVIPLASISSLILSPLNGLLLPLASDLAEHQGQQKLKYLTQSIIKFIPYLTLYFSYFLFLFPRPAIALLFGEKWLGLAELPLQIAVIGYPFSALASYLTTIASGLGLVKERLQASIVIAVVNVVTGVSLTYFFGLTGTMVANVLVHIVSVVIFFLLVRKIMTISVPVSYFVKVGVVMIVLFGLSRWQGLVITNIIAYIWLGMGYSALFWLLGLLIKAIDWSIIKVLLRRSS